MLSIKDLVTEREFDVDTCLAVTNLLNKGAEGCGVRSATVQNVFPNLISRCKGDKSKLEDKDQRRVYEWRGRAGWKEVGEYLVSEGFIQEGTFPHPRQANMTEPAKQAAAVAEGSERAS